MAAVLNHNITEPQPSPDNAGAIAGWRKIIAPSLAILRELAGTTEDEFLQIGSQLQGFYLRSSELTSMASRLVDAVSGERVQCLVERLRQMIADMEAYLATARAQSDDSCQTLERILNLLDQVSEPLEGFQKMYKTLRMLSTSTKIESSRLGEQGAGFLTLAMDVEKLSHLVNEKSGNILKQRQILVTMIADNLKIVRSSKTIQDANIGGILTRTIKSLEELVAVNEHCTDFGRLIASISGEVSSNISEVVSSLQSHDITRQQVEHIVEAMEQLTADFEAVGNADLDVERQRRLIIEAGDVCELQSAQLRHASSALYIEVCSIVDNLRDVARQQSVMATETLTIAGVTDSTGNSFVDGMNRGLSAMTAVLVGCAKDDQEMSTTMKKVAGTIGDIAGFVTDIEEIGSEIDLIALNSQIKAAHTGREGAALGVLAEAIKRLSLEAVIQTAAVSQTLSSVKEVTEHLFKDTDADNNQLLSQISTMEIELTEILSTLGIMNSDLCALLTGLNQKVTSLTYDVERTTGGIDVHEQTKRVAEEVINVLDRIVLHARELEPASTEFKENLRHMEDRYTMESERHIHEAIARKRGGLLDPASLIANEAEEKTDSAESEFGDNVDLF
ncbi:MAG TPA: hypothetical protein VGJ93_15665 [Desulfuromonadaceae bacterium]